MHTRNIIKLTAAWFIKIFRCVGKDLNLGPSSWFILLLRHEISAWPTSLSRDAEVKLTRFTPNLTSEFQNTPAKIIWISEINCGWRANHGRRSCIWRIGNVTKKLDYLPQNHRGFLLMWHEELYSRCVLPKTGSHRGKKRPASPSVNEESVIESVASNNNRFVFFKVCRPDSSIWEQN